MSLRQSSNRLLSLGGLLALVTAAACGPVDPPQESGPTGVAKSAVWVNGGFESGAAGAVPPSWTLTSYSNPGVTFPPVTRANLNLAAGGSLQTQTVNYATPSPDPVLGAAASLRVPLFGTKAAYVNMNPGTGRNVNAIKQTMTVAAGDVDPSDGLVHVRFAVAPVLQNPSHAPAQQPYYWVQLTNLTTGKTLYQDYNASAQPGVPWKVSGGVYYTDWQLVDITSSPGLTLSSGDSVELEVIAAGCSAGAHYGRVYVDGVGPTIPRLFVAGTTPPTTSPGANLTYTLRYKNDGTTAASGVNVKFNLPPNTSYVSTAPGSMTCTNPAVGATTGVVSCTLPTTLAVGAFGTFTVTVNVGATVALGSTIVQGNYDVSATGIAPLLGSKIKTAVVCNADVQCPTGNWCNIAAGACTPKAPNGTAMPTDTGHVTPVIDGKCNTPAGTLVCTSAVCDGTDNKCGYGVGTGPCTTATAATVCRSATCSVAGTCMPVGGCNVDGDCTGGLWCNITSHTCTPKLSNGTAIPTDPPHTSPTLNGTCTTAASTLVCTSKVCDGTDNKCGYANGTGPCTSATAATVCRSGTCSTTGVCVAPGACKADADCTGGNWCNITTSTCSPKLANDTAMPSDPPHTSPTLDGKCTSAAATLVCSSLVCDPDNKCGYANGTGPCTTATAATVCRSATCSVDGKCMPPGGCNVDGDCTGGKWCNIATNTCTAKLANGTAMPTDPPHTTPKLDGKCTPAASTLVCTSLVCDAADDKCGYADGTGPCTAVTAPTVCRSGTCSVAGTCMPVGGCNADGDCGASEWCSIDTHVCLPKLLNGVELPTDAAHTTPVLDGKCTSAAALTVCVSGVCDATDNKCGLTDTKGPCTATTGPVVCRSGLCSAGGTCVAPGGCNVDGDCTGGTWCDITAHLCQAKLANGAAMPSDAAHSSPTLDGKCNADAAKLVCVSGVCDADDKCGYPDFKGPCSDGVPCRSSACSVSGTCMPSGGCNLDGDCTGGKWCNISIHECAATIANGASMPNDSGHVTPVLDGKCTSSAATLVCTSAVCDADDKCGFVNGTGPCTASTSTKVCRSGTCGSDGKCGLPNNEGACDATNALIVCRSGVCDPDGKCGLANGNGTCSTLNAAIVCRSGECSATGAICVPKGGCGADGDCTKAQWCNVSSFTCLADIANAGAMPTDAKHGTPVLDGKCTSAAAAVTCVSGVCDTRDDLCGYDNEGGSVCTSADAAVVCRSGFCSTTGKCVAPSACLVDADCPTGWCNLSKKLCAPKVENGTSMPTDTGHTTPVLDGKCTDTASALVCKTTVCDTADDKCGWTNGTPCKTGEDAKCRATVCFAADGKCGKPMGEPCKDAIECRSDICHPDDNKCGKPVGQPCATAGECRSGECTAGKCDTDTDGDGVSDVTETALGTDPTKKDTDGDGVQDNVELSADRGGKAPFTKVDTDGDGTIDALDTDDDGDTLLTKDELGTSTAPTDTDGDGKPDYLDADDDDDTIPTKQEVADGKDAKVASDDVDGDGKKNWLDTDADGDAILDKDEPTDKDGNGVPDYLEKAVVAPPPPPPPPPPAAKDDGAIYGGGGCAVSMNAANDGLALGALVALGVALAARRRRSA